LNKNKLAYSASKPAAANNKTCDMPLQRGTERERSYSKNLPVSPLKEEEHLKVFLERKYSQKKIEKTPIRAKLISEHTQTDKDESQRMLEDAQQQLKYIRTLCKEKDKYYTAQINEIQYNCDIEKKMTNLNSN
jgi:hypothetical protein